MEQVYENAQAIQNYGAGLVALAIIFAFLIFVVVKIVPVLTKVGQGIISSVDSLKTVIENFTKTVEMMQITNATAISNVVTEIRELKHGIVQNIEGLETKLDYHVICGTRIEDKVDRAMGIMTEVKERTRNCAQENRSADSRTRKADRKE